MIDLSKLTLEEALTHLCEFRDELNRTQDKLEAAKERERSLMRQLDLARATIAFQAYGILAPKVENDSPKS